jgi:hypothetical protein
MSLAHVLARLLAQSRRERAREGEAEMETL